VIDPRRTETCDIADLHLALRPGADVALFNGLLAELAARGATARDFVERHTDGLAAALAAAQATTLADCDLPAADLALFFEWFAATDKTVTLYSQGVNQSSAGSDKVNAILNCHLLTGRIGRPGTGPFSITGQPNAMGGREVGALANTLAAHMDFAAADVERVGRFWRASCMATKPGLKAVDLFEAVKSGEIKAVWVMATNPVASMPNADAVRAALRGCELSIVSEAVRATDTVDACRIRLPALAWAEKDGTVTNSERGISRQRAFLPPPGQARADWWILSQVAQRLGHGAAFAWSNAAEIFAEHAALSAFENDGHRDFDIGAYARIDAAAYEALTPFVWPARAGAPSGSRFFAEGGFFHPDGRARFVAVMPRPPVHAPNVTAPLRLNTGRVRDQWHTMTRTGKSVRLAGHRPEAILELHPDDAAARGLVDDDIARVSSAWGSATLKVRSADSLRPGDAYAPMHWTAQVSRAGRINAAVNPAVDPISGQPELKHTPIEVERIAVRWHGTILAQRAVMIPDVTYWTKIRGAGFHAYVLAGEEPLAAAQHALSATIRAANPGPWLQGSAGVSAVIADGHVEAILALSERGDDGARDRLSVFMRRGRVSVDERTALLAGGVDAARGGEVCACFGVSCGSVERAIACGAITLDQVGAVTKAGTNCGSCRSDIRALLRAGRQRKAA